MFFLFSSFTCFALFGSFHENHIAKRQKCYVIFFFFFFTFAIQKIFFSPVKTGLYYHIKSSTWQYSTGLVQQVEMISLQCWLNFITRNELRYPHSGLNCLENYRITLSLFQILTYVRTLKLICNNILTVHMTDTGYQLKKNLLMLLHPR